MEPSKKIDLKEIVKIYKKNYSKIFHEFVTVQSDFLSDIYNRYNKDLDSANIVLYFAKNLHGMTLRERDKDLDLNISFDNFWNNHSKINQDARKIIEIAESTGLPKETARRKVNWLIKNKVLYKDKKSISWSPPIEQKKSYNSVVDRQILQISKLLQIIAFHLNVNINKDKVSNELRNNFSFFWYHYIKTQLEYLKMWQIELNDLELVLISLQCVIQTNLSFRNKNVSYEEHFVSKGSNSNEKFKNSTEDPSVSATSIAEITGIPRATCIRKLEKLNRMKVIKKNTDTKRYSVDLKNLENNNINSKKITENTIRMFSEFYLVVLKALDRKNIYN